MPIVLVVDDLAEDARRVEPGHPGQVDRRLGVAGPLEHPALASIAAGGCGRDGPGRRDASAGSMRAWTVAARSEAEMPVVVPWRQSTLQVNAVRCASVFCSTIELEVERVERARR